jgi:hypothetical protein
VVLDGVLAPALAQRALDGARALHEAGLLHAGMLEYIIFILNVLQVYTQSKYLYRMGFLTSVTPRSSISHHSKHSGPFNSLTLDG